MDFYKAYLYITLFLLTIFFMLMIVYGLYLTQQKVMSVALTSADVAFFPVRASAAVIRSFFRLILLGFDLTLIGLRFFLMCFRWALVCMEMVIEFYQLPVKIMIGILQRLRRWRRPKNVVESIGKKNDDSVVSTDRQTSRNEEVKAPKPGIKMILTNAMVNIITSNIHRVVTVREFIRKRAGLNS